MFHVEANTATMRFVSDYSIDDGTFKVNVWAAYPTRDQVSEELKHVVCCIQISLRLGGSYMYMRRWNVNIGSVNGLAPEWRQAII